MQNLDKALMYTTVEWLSYPGIQAYASQDDSLSTVLSSTVYLSANYGVKWIILEEIEF
jgi:hypothetical protein